MSMPGLFLLSYTVIALKFEWSFWTGDNLTTFAQYAHSEGPTPL